MRDLLCLDKPRALHAERSMYATPALAGAVLYSVLRLAAAGDGAATSAAAAVEAAAAAIWDTAGGAHDVPDSGSTLAWLARLLGWGGSPPVSPRGAAAAAAARRPGAPAATTASRDLTASLPFDATYFVPWAVCLLLRWAAWTWRLALPHWARRRQSIFGDVTRSLRPLMLTPSEPTFTVTHPRPLRRSFVLGAPHPRPLRRSFVLGAPHPRPLRRSFVLGAPHPRPLPRGFILGAPHPCPLP
eukprot:scaffold23832_cov62-Isochrysis_galbana.AAC.1